MTHTVDRVGRIGHQKPGASPIPIWSDVGLPRRRDEGHDPRQISGQQRLTRDVERAHFIAKARRKGAFQIVKGVETLVDELKAQPGGRHRARIS